MKRVIEIFMMLTVCLSTRAALADSLLTISKAYSYNYTSLDTALSIVHALQEKGEEPAWRLQFVKGDLYRNTCHFHHAIDCFHQALAAPEVKRDTRKQMIVWRAMMNCHDMLMDDLLLADDIYKLEQCANECGDSALITVARFVKGKRFHLHGKKEEGYRYCLESFGNLKRYDFERKLYSLRTCCEELVKMYRNDGRFDEALDMSHLFEKLVRTESAEDIPGELGRNLEKLYAQRASLLVGAERYGEADQAYQQWKEIPHNYPFDEREVLSYLLISNKFDEALTVIERYKDYLNAEGDSVSVRMLEARLSENHAHLLLGNYDRVAASNSAIGSIAYQLHQLASKKEMSSRFESLQEHDRLHHRNMWLLGIILVLSGLLIVVCLVLWYRHRFYLQAQSIQRALNSLSAYQKAFIKADESQGKPLQPSSAVKQPSGPPASRKPSSASSSTTVASASRKKTEEEDDEDEMLFVELDKQVVRGQLFLNPNLSREDLMRLIGVDRNHIGRIMSRYSGASNVSTYINQKRAYYAANYIKKHPEYTIAAVVEACGMNNSVTLNRSFKDLFGMSPSEYRQRLLNGSLSGV